MKMKGYRFHINPRYTRILQFTRLLIFTGFAQLIVQALGLICGILVIRTLPTHEYALYTLANTMIGTMLILADGGISAGVISQGARVWQNTQKLGAVISTGLALRKKFAIGTLLIGLPILFYLLQRHGAGWLFSIAIILAVIPTFLASLSGILLQIVPKLVQNTLPVQKIQISVNLARLIILGMTITIFPWAFVAVLAVSIPQMLANKQLFKISSNYALISGQPDVVVREEILAMVKRTLPYVIYYSLFEQITIWIASFFGSTSSIAQVGAFERVATILVFINVIFTTLIIPRFARLTAIRNVVLNYFLKIQTGLLILGIFITIMAYLFSSQVLWILGPTYLNLKTEFVLSIAGSYIFLMANMLIALLSGRGWTINPFFIIPSSLITIILGIKFIDISTLKGLFRFNILVMGIIVLIYSGYGFFKIYKDHQPGITI